MDNLCVHKEMIKDVTPSGRDCAECVKSGDVWIHLRMCLTCGNIACCDSSKNQHAKKHAEQANHPVIRSFQPGETWKWCYIDEVMFD